MNLDDHVGHEDPWYLRFHDLMPHRVREILLLSSPYDAFTLEEDGHLTERIFNEYSELNLSAAPRVTHVSTGARAVELLSMRRFDLVLTMVRIADIDVSAFARTVKAVHPDMPVVLLVLTEADLRGFPGGVDPSAIDHVFWWTGDARILLAIIKIVEDALNAPHDTRVAGVRVMVVVEDSVRRYSSFLSALYAELMTHSGTLAAEGINDLQRLMRMRARPKIVLARTYEQALSLFERYRDYVVALLSDVRFPRQGEEDPEAGFQLASAFRAETPELPVLLQSADPGNAPRAAAMGAGWADKSSPTLLEDIRGFVTDSLGFGDFVFRLRDRTEVARARDMFELEDAIRTVPAEALVYHATRNHFSLWLMARTMFGLARELRPRRMEEFGDAEGLRAFLLRVVGQACREAQQGVITDMAWRSPRPGTHFLRLGKGSIGGKARGVAFVNSALARYGFAKRFPDLPVRVPRSVVVSTDEFDRFCAANGILPEGAPATTEREVLQRCLDGRLSAEIVGALQRVVADLRGPLAVRSSSLLEDSLDPFAGVYATYMLPNNHPDAAVRAEQLCRAVKAVFASTYGDDARAYIASTAYSIEEAKMAVLIQEVVGRAHGSRFYPDVSGVVASYNYYPFGDQRAEDGVAQVALGLGHTVVQGGATLDFSPASPAVLPQFLSASDYVRHGQREFTAIDLSRSTPDLREGTSCTLGQYDLRAAEEDGTLALVGSVYVPDDDAIRDRLDLPGPRVVSFHNLLKWSALPLAPALRDVLLLTQEGLNCPVEVEFALDGGDPAAPGGRKACLYILQVRPQGTLAVDSSVTLREYAQEDVLCRTDRALGNGTIDGIRDVVVVKRDDLTGGEMRAVAEQVGEVNARLSAQKAPYLLVGPGRWGSSDPSLGVPVRWGQIAGAKVIVETSFGDRDIEPSQGAHFFHNVVSLQMGYLTLPRERGPAPDGAFLDRAWLDEQPAAHETPEVRHVRLARALRVLLDGRRGAAVVLKGAPSAEG